MIRARARIGATADLPLDVVRPLGLRGRVAVGGAAVGIHRRSRAHPFDHGDDVCGVGALLPLQRTLVRMRVWGRVRLGFGLGQKVRVRARTRLGLEWSD